MRIIRKPALEEKKIEEERRKKIVVIKSPLDFLKVVTVDVRRLLYSPVGCIGKKKNLLISCSVAYLATPFLAHGDCETSEKVCGTKRIGFRSVNV